MWDERGWRVSLGWEWVHGESGWKWVRVGAGDGLWVTEGGVRVGGSG